MSSIVLFTIHFLIHSLKVLMKSWQTLEDSELNRWTNSTAPLDVDSSMFDRDRENYEYWCGKYFERHSYISLFPSPYAMFKCCSAVDEGKEKLYRNFSPVAIFIVV